MTSAAPLRLVCHPASSTPSIDRVEVEVEIALAADGGLDLTYTVAADPGFVVVPPTSADTAWPVDGLWRHTCLEVFLMPSGGSAYREFNFSPSGQWASYAFSASRLRDAAAEAGWRTAPAIAFSKLSQGFTLRATLPASHLPGAAGGLRIGLAAVLETRQPDSPARCTYWALHHPSPQPDFHHPAAFALTLD
jgi:hypothetical protein